MRLAAHAEVALHASSLRGSDGCVSRSLCLALALTACDASERHQPPEALRACRQLPGGEATIVETVERLNALPTSSPSCFLASLKRPLDVMATSSITSAQPAVTRKSPRLFTLSDTLVLSFVPEGDGAHLVEFGQWVSARSTLKAEVELPLAEPLTPEAPFTRVLFGTSGTSCGLCHREEVAHPTPSGSFVSLAFKPVPRSLVGLTELRTLHESCTREEDASERCAMFHALFDFGEVREGAFSSEVATFSD